MHRSKVQTSWLALSTCLLDCVWDPDDRLREAPSEVLKACHTLEVNWGPRLNTKEDLIEKDPGGGEHWGYFVQGYKSHLKKQMNNSNIWCCFSLWHGKTRDEVKGYMRPGSSWNGKMRKQTGGDWWSVMVHAQVHKQLHSPWYLYQGWNTKRLIWRTKKFVTPQADRRTCDRRTMELTEQKQKSSSGSWTWESSWTLTCLEFTCHTV